MKYYTGIGSRETPADVQQLFTRVASRLDELGYTLRSGGADGADLAFERGATNKEVFLPWRGFNGSSSTLVWKDNRAMDIARELHPAWGRLSQGAQKLMARNIHQVLGWDLNNIVLSDFILCWTPNGKGGGGTGQAIRLAKVYNTPVIDAGRLSRAIFLDEIKNIIKEEK